MKKLKVKSEKPCPAGGFINACGEKVFPGFSARLFPLFAGGVDHPAEGRPSQLLTFNFLLFTFYFLSIMFPACDAKRISALLAPAQEENRGRVIRKEPPLPAPKQPVEGIAAGKQVLLLIAVDRYRRWPTLQGPVTETMKLKEVLTRRYHFDVVKELYNEKATKKSIRHVLVRMQKGGGDEHELRNNDSLFIYFGGHGQAFSEEKGNGYWIPHDGGEDMEARAYWLGNSELIGLINGVGARHILVVSDSCFAATLVDAGRGFGDRGKEKRYLKKLYHGPSRKVLTSGGLERVPGESAFARLLAEELERNREPWLDMAMVYRTIERKVYEKTGNHPVYGNLKHTGFDPTASFILFTQEGWDKLVAPGGGKALPGMNLKFRFKVHHNLEVNLGFSINFNRRGEETVGSR